MNLLNVFYFFLWQQFDRPEDSLYSTIIQQRGLIGKHKTVSVLCAHGRSQGTRPHGSVLRASKTHSERTHTEPQPSASISTAAAAASQAQLIKKQQFHRGGTPNGSKKAPLSTPGDRPTLRITGVVRLGLEDPCL